jgi:hypothetical protein
MKLNKTHIYIGIGLAIAAFLYFRKKKSFDNQISIRNAGGEGAGNYYGVKTADRDRAKAELQVGTEGLINGKDKCTITKVRTGESGSFGFKCKEVADGSYNIANPSTFEY